MEIKNVEKQQQKDNAIKKNGFLVLPHPLTNFEIQKYYQNEPRLNSVYSRDNLPRTRDVTYVINFDDYSNIGTIGFLCMYKIMMLLILIVS